MNTISLVIVSSPGCHNCAAFKEVWEKEKENWPTVTTTEVSLMSKDAAPILMKHHILASPGIILNDVLFSTGPVDVPELLKKLTELRGI